MIKDTKSIDEVTPTSPNLLEEHERQTATLREALIEGERNEFMECDVHEIRRKARRHANQICDESTAGIDLLRTCA
jgi:Bacterial antitoxin of ParD toxin-antitoxin type II system and RHH